MIMSVSICMIFYGVCPVCDFISWVTRVKHICHRLSQTLHSWKISLIGLTICFEVCSTRLLLCLNLKVFQTVIRLLFTAKLDGKLKKCKTFKLSKNMQSCPSHLVFILFLGLANTCFSFVLLALAVCFEAVFKFWVTKLIDISQFLSCFKKSWLTSFLHPKHIRSFKVSIYCQ